VCTVDERVSSRYRSHTYATKLLIQLFTLVKHVIFFFVLVIQVVIVVVSKLVFALTALVSALSLVLATCSCLFGGGASAGLTVWWGCISAVLLSVSLMPGRGRFRSLVLAFTVLIVCGLRLAVPSSVLLLECFGLVLLLRLHFAAMLSSLVFSVPLSCLALFVELLSAAFFGLVYFHVAFVGRLPSLLVFFGLVYFHVAFVGRLPSLLVRNGRVSCRGFVLGRLAGFLVFRLRLRLRRRVRRSRGRLFPSTMATATMATTPASIIFRFGWLGCWLRIRNGLIRVRYIVLRLHQLIL